MDQPATCNRQWDRAERHARAWADRMGLTSTEEDRQRLERMGQGRMAGFVAPWADPAELDLLAQWGAFIALVDDGFDRGPIGGSPVQVRTLMDALVAVVDGADASPDLGIPAVRAIVDLWWRSTAATGPRWTERFAALYRAFADTTYEEALARATRTPLALARYVEMRRRTITVLPLLSLVQRGLPGEESALEGLCETVADIVAWTNDVASGERELAEGNDNLVSILVRERRCTIYEAAATARTMISERMDDFDTAVSALVQQGPPDAGLAGRIERIRCFLDGALAWQGETRRNDPADAALGNPLLSYGTAGPEYDSGPRPLGLATGTVPAAGQGAAALRTSIDRLAQHLSPAVSPRGAIPDRCASRVLESALLLALLRATQTHEPQQEQLTRFLRSRRVGASPVDALLIDACLNPAETAGRAPQALADLAGDLRRGTGGRSSFKATMVRTVLHLLCGAPLVKDDLLPPLPPEQITTYTDVNLLATRVICARATGYLHAVTGAERDRLVNSLAAGRNRVFWEASSTTHLLALHAVHSFHPTHPAVDDGILRMTLAQNPDGGLPFLDSQDLWLAAVAGVAFLADDRLRPLTTRMSTFVASWQALDGGWPFASGMHQTDLDTTTRCMEFLQAADPLRHAPQLQRATRYLEDMAGPDGGFPTWTSSDTPDLDMTAGAVIALAPAGQHSELLSRSVAFILDAQRPDGTFERSWTISESSGILRALQALHCVPNPSLALTERINRATARAVGHLTAAQNGDGGWGQQAQGPSDVLSTAQAVSVLARYGDPLAARHGINYLLARQDPDGGFTSVPDQTGPRPLPFDFPVLASLHTLPALYAALSLSPDPATPLDRSPRRRTRGAGRTLSSRDWSVLDSRMSGVLLQAQDAGYEHGRLVVNQRYDHVRPQAVAYPATAEDVAECVTFARDRGIELAVRSGGHSYAGYSTGPGLVVHLRALNSIAIGEGRARLGAGTMGMPAHTALAAAGMGLPLGRCPTIGVAGATLGGGLSAFTRSWGLAIDHLTGVDIVTADGQLRTVGAHSTGVDRDLYWAMLGGGGGNFGVVTALDYSTVDISRLSFTSLVMRWPMKDMSALLQGWTAWNADPQLPRELRTAIEQLSDGGAPSELVVTGTFIGTPQEVEPLLDSLVAAVGRPASDRLVYACSYVQAAAEPERWGAGTFGPRVAFAAKSHIVRHPMAQAAADDMVAAVNQLHHLHGVTGAGGLLIDSMGGAVNDVAADATAFPHRSALGVVQYHSYWHEFTQQPHIDTRMQWLRDIHTTMHPHLGTGGYVNGMDPELEDWESAYYGDNHPRLQHVKAAADPDQFFSQPQTFTPAPASTTTSTALPALPAQVRPATPVPPPRGTARHTGNPTGPTNLDALAGRLQGRLVRPGDHDFDDARILHNQRYDQVRPQAVAHIAHEHDAAQCLAFAQATGAQVAIRSGRHSYAGFSTGPGLVIDVSALDSVTVTGDHVCIGTGVSSHVAAHTLQQAGLALPTGRWGSVGLAGLALGGGKSAFTRAWGLTCDRVTGATIVTPDGTIRRLTADPDDTDAELFWALRGAGNGNFGVVTSLDFDPVDIRGQSFARFAVQWPHEDMARALRGWEQWMLDPRTPREICCDVRLILDGDAPAQPTIIGAWIGHTDPLHATLRTLTEAVGRPPAHLTITPCSYAEAAAVSEHPLQAGQAGRHPRANHTAPAGPTGLLPPSGQPGPALTQEGRMSWAGKSHIVRGPLHAAAFATLTESIDTLYRLGAAGGVYFDALGGAAGEPAPEATAFPHRTAHAVLQYITTWPHDCPPDQIGARMDWIRAAHSAMQTHLGTGAYVNDTDPELIDWQRAYYGHNYPRLQRVKAAFDPQQILDFPQAITPSGRQALPDPRPATATGPRLATARRAGTSRSKVWFITGASRGFGRLIAQAALERGDQVAATARNPHDLRDFVAQHPARALALPLDVTVSSAAHRAVTDAVHHFGQLDVVVNNAGYADLGSIEDTPPEQFRAVIETNLFGVVNVSRAAIPTLRQQGHGHFIQFSSVCGRTTPGVGLGAYHAAKHGVEGFSGALANEMKPFGVHVTIIEPGGFRTEWGTTSMNVVPASDPYQPTVGALIKFRDTGVQPAGDPVTVPPIILHVADMPEPPLRLALGRDATTLIRTAHLTELTQLEAWRPLGESTDLTTALGTPFR